MRARSHNGHVVALLLLAVSFPKGVRSATYFVDYAAGGDDRAGTSAEAAFQHCPGSLGAAGMAAAAVLAPGDRVIFKGGTRYLETVSISVSGSEQSPIVLDGNTEGTFGTGPAILDGGEGIGRWQPCASADDAGGNPQWARIDRATIPKTKTSSWRTLNLCTDQTPLPVAQDPNPSDPLFQENPDDYSVVEGKLRAVCQAKVYPEKGTKDNAERPLLLVFTQSPGAAVVEPIPAAFSVEVPKAITAVALGIAPQPGYAPVLDVAFDADGREVLRAQLQRDLPKVQRFELAAPVTFTKLTVRLLSMHPGVTQNWTAIREVAAFDAAGADGLNFPVESTVTDTQHLTALGADFYAGATFGVYAGNAAILYLPILGYVPAEHRLALEYYSGRQYATTKYALFNSVRFIDQPGEWAAVPTADGRSWELFCLRPRGGDGAPSAIAWSARDTGIRIEKASHVVLRGFKMLRQGGDRDAAGISGRGKSSGVLIQDCEVTLVNGVGITTAEIDDVTLDRCRIHDNPGHTKGIVLRNAERQTVQRCTLERNTSTGIDFYTCGHSTIRGNTVLDHKGMHANGITAYVGCKDLLVEGNRVFGGNVAFTCQNAEGVLVRNNVFSGAGKSCAVGLWTGTLKNLRLYNNTIVDGPRGVEWSAGLFTNCRKAEADGWVIRNNIIDGVAGSFPSDAVFSHNLYTYRGDWQRATAERPERPLAEGEQSVEDAAMLFVDSRARDYHLRVGSPAVDAGVTLGDEVPTDLEGTRRPHGAGCDLGAYEKE